MLNKRKFSGHESIDSTPGTLLIVDDDPINRQVLRCLFELESYQIIEAVNGQDGLNRALADRPDLILLDIMMPGLDGYDVCKALSQDEATASIPVIMVTALSSAQDETKGLDAGAVDFITKPFNPKVIQARVHAHLQLKRDRDILANKSARLELSNRLLEQEIEDHLATEEALSKARNDLAQFSRVREGVIKDLFHAMCEMLSSRDMYTFEHGLRVASIARLIGEDMKLSAHDIEALELGCMLHDISKVAIPDDVLLKPGLFNTQDRKIMMMHPALGAKIFSRQACDPDIIDIIHHHHERLDGSGYPDQLRGDQINHLTKITMVADSYEAMIARRPYKKAMTRTNALARLQQEVEKGRLDGDIVARLVKVTESWDPLAINHDFHDDSTRDLELFRKKTYFKEPLSDFYNYRYLFYLEEVGLLESHSGYTITKISFTSLDQINKQHGYLITDQVIDEVGMNLYEAIDKLNEHLECITILLRKGTTYLLYTNCQDDTIKRLDLDINTCLQRFSDEWHGTTQLTTQHFNEHQSIQDAIYQMLDHTG
ncbi:MAG: response regulator [Proteobacteria bacterium]|nr:response regulator [Desulfobulbaceae bacterium]MBU4151502.1 response regulator [Pseudomonadota bacterium]MDP2107286.1 response regulator [Desulfobulbaceae bacterium]